MVSSQTESPEEPEESETKSTPCSTKLTTADRVVVEDVILDYTDGTIDLPTAVNKIEVILQRVIGRTRRS